MYFCISQWRGILEDAADVFKDPDSLQMCEAKLEETVRAHPGRSSALGVSRSKSVLCGDFMWVGGRLTTLRDRIGPGQPRDGVDSTLQRLRDIRAARQASPVSSPVGPSWREQRSLRRSAEATPGGWRGTLAATPAKTPSTPLRRTSGHDIILHGRFLFLPHFLSRVVLQPAARVIDVT